LCKHLNTARDAALSGIGSLEAVKTILDCRPEAAEKDDVLTRLLNSVNLNRVTAPLQNNALVCVNLSVGGISMRLILFLWAAQGI
jgi:hypothetical protein